MASRGKKDVECTVQLLMIGDSGVGKSSLLLRYSDNSFNKSYMATIGIDFRCKTVEMEGCQKPVQVQVWDTAGQERFRVLTRNYFRGADGIMLTFDVTNRPSFENVGYWMRQIVELAGHDVIVYLVGNKADRTDHRVILQDEGKRLANKYCIPYFECSAKSGSGVHEAYASITREVTKLVKKKNQFKPKDSIAPVRSRQQKRSCPQCVLI